MLLIFLEANGAGMAENKCNFVCRDRIYNIEGEKTDVCVCAQF